jgi:hypothetical protein
VGPYAGKQTGEAALLWTLLENLKPGDVMIADRLYTSYFMFARQGPLRADVVMHLHQTRRTDFRRGRRLGTRDHVVQWARPARPTWMDEATYAGMPATLTTREVRAGGWTLATSLVAAKSVSKIELVDLHHSRWQVELDFRSIKDVMQTDELRCKTAATGPSEWQDSPCITCSAGFVSHDSPTNSSDEACFKPMLAAPRSSGP